MKKRYKQKNDKQAGSTFLETEARTVGIPFRFQILVFVVTTLVCVQATTDPTSFTCTAYNSTVIRLDWTAATDVNVAGYYLYLRRTDGLKTQEGPGITLSARNYISYTFYGLGYYAQYDISINSYSSGGTNYTVYTVSCTTLSDAPDLSNFNLTCEGISYYEISCTWGSLDAVYWNGVPFGWRLGHISYYNDEYTYIDFNTTATLAYTIQGLQFDTKYLINIRSVNTGGFLGPYSSTNSKTLGWPKNTENATRYFCYEAIPGTLEFSWLEMPCTIYSGTIGGLLLICLLLLMLCCCMCCCKGGSKNNSSTEINIYNEENNEYYGDDGDDDDDESEEEYSEEEEEDDDEDMEEEEISDGAESPSKGAVQAKKKKLSDDEKEGSEEDEDESEDEDSDEDSETDVEIYAGLTEEEKKKKKEERAAEKAKKKEEKAKRKAEKKKLKEDKNEESKKLKIEERKRKEEERKEKIRERMKKRNAMMAGAATIKTVDETKKAKEAKEKKKKPASSDEDEESEGYYEDWNPDADENPDVEVNKVSMKENKKVKDGKNSDDKTKDTKPSDKKKSDKNDKNKKNKKGKSKSKESDEDDDDSEDSEYDDDDEDSEEEDYTSEDENQPKKKSKKSISKDSGRGSASSNLSDWGDDNTGNKSVEKANKSKSETQAEPKKKGGFLSKLFGTSKSKQDSGSNNNKSHNKTSNQIATNADYGDWGDDGDDQKPSNNTSSNINTANNTSSNTNHTTNLGGTNNNSYQQRNALDQLGNPIVINAPIIVNSNPYNNTGNQDSKQYNDRPPPGYGRNPNGTFHPLPGNYNKVTPPGFIRNSDGSIQRNGNEFQNSSDADNGPPPGYAKNFDGTFYPVPGNNNPVIPPGFSRNPDGTIFRNPQQLQSNNYSSVAPPGFGKNPNGTFYPLPGNNNPVVPQGYAKNRDGSIYRTSNQGNSGYQVPYSTNDPPPGYGRNPDGTFYPKPGNRNPVVPPGFARNPDGTIYRNSATSFNNQSDFASNQAPPGYASNPDGTFHPLPGNFNQVVPLGFSKNPNGSIYRSSREPFTEHSDVAAPPGYMKTNDGSFRPLPTNRNPVVPPGFAKNSDGSIYYDPYQTSSSTSNDPPSGYRKNPDGTFYPLPNNRNPVVPTGYVKNPNGSIMRDENQTNSQYGNNQYNRNAPPQGFAPNPDGSFRPLPGNKNPIVPFGFTKNVDGTIRENNNRQLNQEIPPGYAKNPDGTFRPLPGNSNPVVPVGFTKNPDGTIRRNRSNPINRNNEVPSGYGKNPDGTFFPLKGNLNPVVPEGYRKNPDGTISKLPNYQSKQALASNRNPYAGNAGRPKAYANTSGAYPYGPTELDPPEPSDDRDKFNALFVAKAKQKAIQKKDRAIEQDHYQASASNNPANFTGDGEDIFAPQSGQIGDYNDPSTNLGAHGAAGQHINAQPSLGNMQRSGPNDGSIPTGQNASNAGTTGVSTNGYHGNNRDKLLNDGGTNVSFPIPDYNNGNNGAVGYPNSSGHDNTTGNHNNTSNVHAGRKPGQPPFSFGSGKNPDIVITNRKPISFRENDPKYHDFSQRRKSKQHRPHDMGDERQNDGNAHSDASDTEVLPDDRPSSHKKPVLRFRNSNQPPAWDSKRTDNDKSDKSGKKTPVTELKPRQELIEPEPVIGTDRLGNKFPFLNINQSKESKPGDKTDKNSKKDENPENRRKSNTAVVLRGRELVDKKERDFPPLPNTLTGEAGAIAASNDLGGLKQETRDEIFYGFGVGRWRVAAAKWLNKWKMKKKPVQTAKSSWD